MSDKKGIQLTGKAKKKLEFENLPTWHDLHPRLSMT
jgi:hypothetical protein